MKAALIKQAYARLEKRAAPRMNLMDATGKPALSATKATLNPKPTGLGRMGRFLGRASGPLYHAVEAGLAVSRAGGRARALARGF